MEFHVGEPAQFGFLPRHGPESALLAQIDHLLPLKWTSVFILQDFFEAFSIADHEILLSYLREVAGLMHCNALRVLPGRMHTMGSAGKLCLHLLQSPSKIESFSSPCQPLHTTNYKVSYSHDSIRWWHMLYAFLSILLLEICFLFRGKSYRVGILPEKLSKTLISLDRGSAYHLSMNSSTLLNRNGLKSCTWNKACV